jgi:hypothetical protein
MATSKPFAYNPGDTLAGTTQVGTLAVGTGNNPYGSNYGGLTWWNGPDEDQGYIIATSVPAGNQPTPLGNIGTVQFWSSDFNPAAGSNFTVRGFLAAANAATGNNYTTYTAAANALPSLGYWTNFDAENPQGLFIIENNFVGVTFTSVVFNYGSGEYYTPNEGSVPLTTGNSITFYNPDQVSQYIFGFSSPWTPSGTKTVKYTTYVNGVQVSETTESNNQIIYQPLTLRNSSDVIRVVVSAG